MCGIFLTLNYNKKASKEAKDIFNLLMVANSTRGEDSTGYIGYNCEKKVFTKKKATSSIYFKHLIEGANYALNIGHTRMATIGGVSDDTAHPFKYKSTYIIHNGMISNHSELARLYSLKYKVDSEVLAPIIHDNDLNTLSTLKGSANIIGLNTVKNELYISRHNNPLFYGILKKAGILAVSSIESDLFTALNVIEPCEIKAFSDDTFHTIDLSTMKTTEVKIKYTKETPNYYYSWGDYSNAYSYAYCDGCGERLPYKTIDTGREQLCFDCRRWSNK